MEIDKGIVALIGHSSPANIISEDAFSLISILKKHCSIQVYMSFLNILNSYRVGEKGVFEVQHDLTALLHFNPYLVNQFHHFIQKDCNDPPIFSSRKQRKSKFSDLGCGVGAVNVKEENTCYKSGSVLFQKVQKSLCDSDGYLAFLKLIHCCNSGKINKSGSLCLITELLGNYPELLTEFQAYLKDFGPMGGSLACGVVKKLMLESPELEDKVDKKKQKCETEENIEKYMRKLNAYAFKQKKISRHEKLMFMCEDRRFELDMLVSSVSSAVNFVEGWLNSINENKTFKKTRPVRFLMTVERVYGDHGLKVLEVIQKDGKVALPLILPRLKQKQEEWTSCRSDFNMVWVEIYAKIHNKSLTEKVDREGLETLVADSRGLDKKFPG